MPKIDEKSIPEIAEHLEAGESCYLNRKTGKPSFFMEEMFELDSDAYQDFKDDEEFRAILDHPHRFDILHPMPPSDGFEVMKRFANMEGLDRKLRRKLLDRIHNKSPFSRFKSLLHERGGVELQAWYRFRDEQYQLWVRESLKFMEWL